MNTRTKNNYGRFICDARDIAFSRLIYINTMQENAKLNVAEDATAIETAEKKRDFLRSFSHQQILEYLLQRIAYDIIPEIDEDDDIQDIIYKLFFLFSF